MRVEFLGTGGYHPNERRQTACVMLPEVGVIFDAGTSFFRVPERLETRDVHIFLSHAHLDHIAGLTYFLGPLLNDDVDNARLYATTATLQAVREHLFAQPLFPIQPEYEYVALEPQVAVPSGGVLSHVALEHPGGSTGYRIDWPEGSLAYITDTVANGSYLEFVRDVDLLIHECYFPDERSDWSIKTGHSHTTPVAELARDAQVGRLMLVHIDPQQTGDDPIHLETARRIFPNCDVAEDLMTVDF